MFEQRQVPGMSKTATEFITAKLIERKKAAPEYYIIEYGAGYSTKFFIDILAKENIKATYVAVERDPWWYGEVLKMFPGGKVVKHLWSLKKYLAFAKAKPQNVWNVPERCRRLYKTQRAMLSPKGIAQFVLKRSKQWFDASYSTRIGTVQFECPNILEPFKDQFGESPNKREYIHAPLARLMQSVRAGKKCHALVMVDGGPRADVVKEFFSLIDEHKNLTVDIFLLEAYRGYYQHIIASRPGGRFIAAEKNERLDGKQYLHETDIEQGKALCAELMSVPSIAEALKREVWYYTNKKEKRDALRDGN